MTHKSRNDRRRVFKLDSKVGHVTRHAQQLFNVKKSEVKVRVTWRISRQKRNNSAVYGHINCKRGGNYRRGGRRVWYTFYVSRSKHTGSRNMADIQNINAKINVKRRQIAEILHSNRKSGSANRPALCLNLHLKCINNRFCACAVQMLLTMAANATKWSTFVVQYGKSTSSRTTAIWHFRATLTERVISRMRTN